MLKLFSVYKQERIMKNCQSQSEKKCIARGFRSFSIYNNCKNKPVYFADFYVNANAQMHVLRKCDKQMTTVLFIRTIFYLQHLL